MGLETINSTPSQKDKVLENIIDKNSQKDKIESHAVLMGNLNILKDLEFLKNNPYEYTKKVQETFNEINDYFISEGAEPYEKVMDIYSKYQDRIINPLIIRREDPNKMIDLVHGNNIEMVFDPDVVRDRGDKYANSALWPHGDPTKTTGLHNAFAEGRGMAGPIAMIAAYNNNEEHMKIEIPEKAMLNVGTLHRQSVRILSGHLEKEDLAFVVVRMTAKFFDRKLLSESERQNPNLIQIFRAYEFKNKSE